MATVMDAGDIARALKRISHEIIEHNQGLSNVVILGIPTRGAYLSSRLVKILSEIEKEVPSGTLDITLHRDDLRTRPPRPLLSTIAPSGGIEGKDVVLVDDVLFTGRTIKAALDALLDYGRPERVELCVLVDRHEHRQFPIQPDYSGKKITTLKTDKIKLTKTESGDPQVILLNQ